MKDYKGDIADFTDRIVKWYSGHGRVFPWRDTSDPYAILVAEVLLHHTDAKKVATVFSDLMKAYPTPDRLARASPAELLFFIRTLGKHHRAEDLPKLGRQLVEKSRGLVPQTRDGLLGLEGVGPYTANAVLCFAFGEPVPILDTNSIRVLGRYFGRKFEVDATRRDPAFWRFAARSIPIQKCREYNWGLLDLGALVCTSRRPRCLECPVHDSCQWFRDQTAKHPTV